MWPNRGHELAGGPTGDTNELCGPAGDTNWLMAQQGTPKIELAYEKDYDNILNMLTKTVQHCTSGTNANATP